MKLRNLVLMLVSLALAAPAVAEVSDMALDRAGNLYRLAMKGESLYLSIQGAESEPVSIMVPGTTGDLISNQLIAYEEETATIVMAWQEDLDGLFTRIMVAAYQDETWFLPIELAGEPSLWAKNPTMLLQRTETGSIEEENQVITYFAHMAWWEGDNLDDGGHAVCTSIPLVNGDLLIDDADIIDLVDLIPFGIACGLTVTEHSLDSPKLFIDPVTSNPHLIFAAIQDCRFGIMELVVTPPDEDAAGNKRRRNIAMWGKKRVIPIRPGLTLADAKFAVGPNLNTVVMHWDKEAAIDYAILGGEQWSEIKTLALSEDLSHEEAVELIQRLVR